MLAELGFSSTRAATWRQSRVPHLPRRRSTASRSACLLAGAALATLCVYVRPASVLGGCGFLGLTPSPPQNIAESRRQLAILSSRDPSSVVEEERGPVLALSFGRREGALAALSFGTWISGSREASAAVAENVKEQVRAAATTFRQLQGTLKGWKGTGVDAGSLVKSALAGTLETPITIKIASGGSLGVEADGLTVTGISREDLGWKIGDVISEINGVQVEDIDELKEKLKSIGNIAITLIVKRLSETPFPTLERALRKVYEDSDAPLPEVEEVMRVYSSLTFNAALAAEDVLGVDDLLRDIDAIKKEIEKFEDVLSGVVAKSNEVVDDSAGDMSDLFG